MPALSAPQTQTDKRAKLLWSKWRKVTMHPQANKPGTPPKAFVDAVAYAKSLGFSDQDLLNTVYYASFTPIPGDTKKDEKRVIRALKSQETLDYVKSLSVVLSYDKKTLNSYFGRYPYTHEAGQAPDDVEILGGQFAAEGGLVEAMRNLSKILLIPLHRLPQEEVAYAMSLLADAYYTKETVAMLADEVRRVTGMRGVLPSDVIRATSSTYSDSIAAVASVEVGSEEEVDDFYAGQDTRLAYIDQDPDATMLLRSGYPLETVVAYHLSVAGGMRFWVELLKLTDPDVALRELNSWVWEKDGNWKVLAPDELPSVPLSYPQALEYLHEHFGAPLPAQRNIPPIGDDTSAGSVRRKAVKMSRAQSGAGTHVGARDVEKFEEAF